jgi:restriction system protein
LDPLDLTPVEFELLVRGKLIRSGAELSAFRTEHLEVVAGESGSYVMDVTARFKALGEAEFLVLVECKRHRNPIKRELVEVLHDKLRESHAQKAMMFATTPFQEGAIRYAADKRIALVEIKDGRSLWHTRGRTPVAEGLPDRVDVPSLALVHVREADNGSIGYSVLGDDNTVRTLLGLS